MPRYAIAYVCHYPTNPVITKKQELKIIDAASRMEAIGIAYTEAMKMCNPETNNPGPLINVLEIPVLPAAAPVPQRVSPHNLTYVGSSSFEDHGSQEAQVENAVTGNIALATAPNGTLQDDIEFIRKGKRPLLLTPYTDQEARAIRFVLNKHPFADIAPIFLEDLVLALRTP